MLIEQLQKYKIILGAVKASSITPQMVGNLLSLAGFRIDPILAPLVSEVIRAKGEGKSVFDLVGDEKLMAEVEALLNITGKQSSDEAKQVESISVTAALRCPHCDKHFAVIDAPGVYELINKQ